MPYGYVMCEQIAHHNYQWKGAIQEFSNSRWGPLVDREIKGSVRFTTKQRLPANPFGFGVSEKDLTPRQLSILAALFLNKGNIL